MSHYIPAFEDGYKAGAAKAADEIAIGQRGAACGASAGPTGCASNGDTEDEV